VDDLPSSCVNATVTPSPRTLQTPPRDGANARCTAVPHWCGTRRLPAHHGGHDDEACPRLDATVTEATTVALNRSIANDAQRTMVSPAGSPYGKDEAIDRLYFTVPGTDLGKLIRRTRACLVLVFHRARACQS